MLQSILVEKFLKDMLPIANSASSEEESTRQFSNFIKSALGLDAVSITLLSDSRMPDQINRIEDYIINTRKQCVDNQLSEYSAFPEFISYKGQGYGSCAIMPIMASGNVIAVLSMLSTSQNKFTQELLDNASFCASIIGFALAYKHETNRNVRLAKYFDAAFNSSIPQLIVASSNSVYKMNRAAASFFSTGGFSTKNINELIGLSFDELLKSQYPKQLKIQLKHNGSNILLNVVSSKISDKTLHLTLEDITPANTFERLLSALNSSADACVIFFDESLSITGIHGGLGKYRHSNSDELMLNRKITDFVREAQSGTFAKTLNEAKETGTVAGTVWLELLSGECIKTHSILSRTASGYALIAVRADLEDYVKELESSTYDFINAASDMALKVDNFGYIKDCNMAVEGVLGYSKSELMGKELKGLYMDADTLYRDLSYVSNGGKINNTYINLMRKDGTTIPATHSIRLFKEDNSPLYMVLVKELLTKHLIDDQEKKIKEYQSQVNKFKMESGLKTQFIYNITHELKTPLTSIKGFSKLLYDGEFGPLNDSQKEYLKTIIEEADRLTSIITQVLDAAKLEAKKVKLDIKEVDFKELEKSQAINALTETVRKKGLKFDWVVDYNVPSITADPNRLIQAFVNLIANATKFTSSGGITVKITRKSKKMVKCEVSDTGIGISDIDKRKIFKKFYQATKKDELVKQDGSGTGLGLSITKEIIGLHHGKIGFESELGKWSRFWFTLPINYRPSKKEMKV